MRKCIPILFLVMTSYSGFAQKVFVGSAHSMPVIDATSHATDTVITGFYRGVVNWIDKSSDGSFVYGGTEQFQTTRKLFKYNTSDYSVVLNADISSYVNNLQVTDDDTHLLYSYQTKIYKASTSNLVITDSIEGFSGVRGMKILDSKTIACSDNGNIYRINYTTGAKEDSIVLKGLVIGLGLNNDRTKLYATALDFSSGNKLAVIDLSTFSIDTTVSLSGMQGDPIDAISSKDGKQILVISVGSTLSNGGFRVYSSSDFSLLHSEEHAGGGGRMTMNSNGEIWIPRQTSKKIYIYDPTSVTISDSIDFSTYSNAPPFKAIFTGVPLVSVDEISLNNSFGLYPNPANNHVTISFNETVDHSYVVHLRNALGQVVQEVKSTKQELTLDLSTLTRGIYFVTTTNSNVIGTAKIIKQ